MSRPAQLETVRTRQRVRAGIVSRALADVLDLLVAFALALLFIVIIALVRAVFGGSFEISTLGAAGGGGLFAAVLLVYLTYGWGLDGQTAGKLILGLQLLRKDGGDVSFTRGLVRALLYLIFPIGFLWALVSSRNCSIQDHVVDTAVVHDWGFAVAPAGRVARAALERRAVGEDEPG